MREMIVGYTHDESIVAHMEGILSLAEQYDSASRMKWVMRNKTYRVILCIESDKVIGYLVYAPSDKFFGNQSRLRPYLLKVSAEGVDLTQTTTTIFGHISKSLPDDDVLHEMIKTRTADAKERGYTKSLININASPEVDEELHVFCKMKRITVDANLIPSLVGGTLEILNTKNEHGDNIIVHHYA